MKTHMRSYASTVPAGSYLVLLALVLLTAPPPAAQSTIESAGSRAAQFVLVIDDSGSMARRGAWGEAADADRLSVFAVRSLINTNRRQILDLLQLDGRLAQYDGKLTPCRSALSQVGWKWIGRNGNGVELRLGFACCYRQGSGGGRHGKAAVAAALTPDSSRSRESHEAPLTGSELRIENRRAMQKQ